MSDKQNILKKIEDKTAVCAVIGLGYVGLPLAVELAEAGFKVLGIDTDPEKVKAVNAGESYILDVSSEDLEKVTASGNLEATLDYGVIRQCDTVNICVPTPLRKTRDPDISYIVSSLDEIKKYVHPGMLVILESTTYPGTTDEVVIPALIREDLKTGENIFFGFSPERVDPGNPVFQTGNIPKVVGGATSACSEIASALYRNVVSDVFPVSSTRVAEMVKLLENTFRSVNIGLVNELALMCDQMGINVWEVIDGASTKPFGFMPFYPGPGLGGHCIPIDPFYLSWKARSVGFEARFIELAGQINESMPKHVTNKAIEALNGAGKAVKSAKILILGIAYKRNISDVRESPAFDIASILNSMGADISYCDPYIDEFVTEGVRVPRKELTKEELSGTDLVIIVTDHDDFNYELLIDSDALVLDTRNALKGKGLSI